MGLQAEYLLTLWTRWAAFAVSKFPCLRIDGNADSCGTSAVFQTVTLFYAVCSIFPSKSSCFWPNKVRFFATGNSITHLKACLNTFQMSTNVMGINILVGRKVPIELVYFYEFYRLTWRINKKKNVLHHKFGS
jgi:hypothetical protein